MKNFAFGNLTHDKSLVPESSELQFIDRLCLQRLVRMHFFNYWVLILNMFFNISSHESFMDTLYWTH